MDAFGTQARLPRSWGVYTRVRCLWVLATCCGAILRCPVPYLAILRVADLIQSFGRSTTLYRASALFTSRAMSSS